MNILFIDNFDSFSHLLVYEFRQRGCEVSVWRNDVPTRMLVDKLEQLPVPRLLVLSPGPGHPRDSGTCLALVKAVVGKSPIFGICLGHQIIAAAMGGKVGAAPEIVHGKASQLIHHGGGMFADVPPKVPVGRYHSLVVEELPQGFSAVAHCDGQIMAMENTSCGVAAVQFHPESILTPVGGKILDNIIAMARSFHVAERGAE